MLSPLLTIVISPYISEQNMNELEEICTENNNCFEIKPSEYKDLLNFKD